MRKLTTEEFIKRAREKHGDRYDYSLVDYVDMFTPVEIVCRKHGVFKQAPNGHVRGAGCSLCRKGDDKAVPWDEFLARARAAHGDRYEYDESSYTRIRDKVRIFCKIHGPFLQEALKHANGQGCPKCAPNCKDTTESFIEKARKIHGDFYDYSKVDYVDEHTKVCIVDPEYGEFWQQPNAHLNGRVHSVRRAEATLRTRLERGSVSKAENDAFGLLEAKFGQGKVRREYWSPVYPFACDFYIPAFDLYIEMNAYPTHGGHWFNPLDPEDIKTFGELAEKAKTSSWTKNVLEVWTQGDPMKRRAAIDNNLNYVVFWKNDLSDFMAWYNAFDFDNPVLKLF